MKFGILWDPAVFDIDSSVLSANDINILTGYNTGNMAYVEGLRSIFDGCDFEFIPWWYDSEKISKDIEILVFPAANQLGGHIDLSRLTENFLAYKRPVVAIGLGAQFDSLDGKVELSESAKNWLETLISLSPDKSKPNIVLRGDFTAGILKDLGYDGTFVAAGCPSQFLNLSADLYSGLNKTVSESDFYSLCYNTSHYSWPWAAHFDCSAFDYIQRNAGSMLVQAPAEYVELVKARGGHASLKDFDQLMAFFSISNPDEMIQALKKYFFTFPTAFSWRSWLTHFDFNFGTRIHGTMLSLQSGVPSFLIVHDSRTEELAKKLGVPYAHYAKMSDAGDVVTQVVDQIKSFDYTSIDVVRRKNGRLYADFLYSLGLPISKRFSSFIF